MEHLKDILLTDRQKEFISGLINMYGDGQHPWCSASTFDGFTLEYVRELLDVPEVEENLSDIGLDTFKSVREAIENPKNHYEVKPNSRWDYDRSLDDARRTIGLKVRCVENGMVSFYGDMPYESYSIEYFDGKTFKPHVKKQ